MAEKNVKKEYSWKEKYDHVFNCYCSLWNSAINYIAENFGPKELDQYLKGSMKKDVLGRSTFPELKEGIETETFLGYFVSHHVMLGSKLKIIKADQDEIMVDLIKCGSKSMLVEKFGEGAKYYCRHCEILPLWEQMGWNSEVDKSQAQILGGQNIGCRRIFRSIKK